jgi:NO-binding membrane sensor protein with MHYT domain
MRIHFAISSSYRPLFFPPPSSNYNRVIGTMGAVEWRMGPMGLSLLISILITFLVIVLVLYLVNMLPLDARMRQIVRVIVIIIGIISLLKYLAVF